MTPYERRLALEKIAADGRFAQFGQSHDSTTSNGSEACTHVVCQYLIKVWRNLDVTIDEISKVAGYKLSDVGMNSAHLDKVFAHWKLPYVATWRAGSPSSETVSALIEIVRNRGPVLLCINYGFYPLDAKLKGNASRNGFAAQGGRSDLGFAGDHATCFIAARWVDKPKGEYRPRFIDPDHGSGNRPQVPDFDVFRKRQLVTLWDTPLNGRTSSGQIQRHVGYVPSQPWNGATK